MSRPTTELTHLFRQRNDDPSLPGLPVTDDPQAKGVVERLQLPADVQLAFCGQPTRSWPQKAANSSLGRAAVAVDAGLTIGQRILELSAPLGSM
jgi:hypothetical protein